MQLFYHPVQYEKFMTHKIISFSIFEHSKEATYLGFVLKQGKEATYLGFVLKQTKEATYLGFVRLKGKRKIGKIKLNERNIFLSRDSCSCRAKEATYWGCF